MELLLLSFTFYEPRCKRWLTARPQLEPVVGVQRCVSVRLIPSESARLGFLANAGQGWAAAPALRPGQTNVQAVPRQYTIPRSAFQPKFQGGSGRHFAALLPNHVYPN